MSLEERDARRRRLSKNQALFRSVNERVERAGEHFGAAGPLSFVCECSHTDCGLQIELAHEQYESVRAHSSHFFVAPDHELLEIEDVVERHPTYFVVAKLGEGAAVAAAYDERVQGGG